MKLANGLINHFYVFHPVSLLFYYILTATALFKCSYNLTLIYTFISFSIYLIHLKGLKAYIKGLPYYGFLIITTGIFNVIFNHSGEHIFLYVNDTPLTFDSLFYGLYTGLFVSCLIIWFNCFNLVIDNGRLHYLIGSRFKVIGLMLSMTFSFTDKFRHKLDLIRMTLHTQGIKTINLKYGAIVFSLLLSVMLEDSAITADSMIARGYISGRRRLFKKYIFHAEDIIIALISSCLFTLIFLSEDFIVLLVLLPVFYNMYRELIEKFFK